MSGHSDSASRKFSNTLRRKQLYSSQSCPVPIALFPAAGATTIWPASDSQQSQHVCCSNHLRKTRLDVGSVANAGHVGQGTPCTLSLLLQGVLSGHDIAFEVWPRQRYASFVHVDKDSLLAHRNSASKPRNPLQKLHNLGVSKREPLGGWVFELPVFTLPLTFPFWALFLVPV